MKDIFSGVADVLLNDTDLKIMVGYTTKNNNILRAYAPTGDFTKLVIFYAQPELVIQDFCSQIRNAPLIIRVYDRNSDISVEDIAERIILLLDGADLSVAGQVHVYDCAYFGDIISTTWNEELKSFERVLRFSLVFRVDAVTGQSGMPVRKRAT